MPELAKTEAIAQITRAIGGLQSAIATLQMAYGKATFAEQGEILQAITELGQRLDINKIFLAHLKTSEVTVRSPSAHAYARLDNALARLHAIDVATDSVRRILNVVGALATTVKSTRREVSSRAT